MAAWIFGAKHSCCPWWREAYSYNSRHQAVACVTMASACQPPSWHQIWYVSLWLCLNLRFIQKKKNNLIYVYGDWLFHINDFDSDKLLFLHNWPHSFTCLTTVPASDNKSLGCCCRNSRPSVINPLINSWCHVYYWNCRGILHNCNALSISHVHYSSKG